MELIFDEVRRLTGPNLLWDKPGALVDVLIKTGDSALVVASWNKWASQCLSGVGWPHENHTHRLHAGGASFAISAPLDALYTACDVAELAWHCCAAELLQEDLPDWQDQLDSLKKDLTEEQNPPLLALIAKAQRENIQCLVDDDFLSLGTGRGALSWPVNELPDQAQLNWSGFSRIPVAFVTGTNGKSTSVRLAAAVAKVAGFNAGVTSTDFIKVGDVVIDQGDYSGPGGARILLRDQRAEMAFLEVARGGLLRRGLPVDHVDAALITNVASDHLGEYGINTVEELAETKFMVAKGLSDGGVLVLNADNQRVVEQAKKTNNTLCWFSTDEQNSLIQAQLQQGARAVFVRDNHFMYHDSGEYERFLSLVETPMTFNGTAIHNVQNALGVIGLCKALDISSDAINTGLRSFGRNTTDNPGRGNVYEVNGIQVIVDFAHNEHSVRAMVEMVKRLPAKRRIVMFGHAGDRSDQDIHDLTNAVADLDASLYLISELERYLRGRQLGDLPALIKTTLAQRAIAEQKIVVAQSPLSGAQDAINAANNGDVVLLFALDQRQQIHDWLVSL